MLRKPWRVATQKNHPAREGYAYNLVGWNRELATRGRNLQRLAMRV